MALVIEPNEILILITIKTKGLLFSHFMQKDIKIIDSNKVSISFCLSYNFPQWIADVLFFKLPRDPS